ncbi:hypothetical protein GCK72_014358 [Caenorhabditis remanei]|uniref:F-box domain-containing protein n=1 Tax=Caenorhabditis remanei TaxID=31234 RepID=A0A6A5GTH0_CAERE|nr:hypothetical protein GCK72_014358 [Caenorhabditis remanei]KAF1757901.1 hypothetical protein GCK72_014358 [Caenorhabditis remanei]
MNLLKFPLLVQHRVYQELSILELFILSLTSRRVKTFIKLFKWEVHGVLFSFMKKEVYFFFQDSNELWQRNKFQIPLDANFVCYREDETDVFYYHFKRKKCGSTLALELQQHIFDLFSTASKQLKLTVFIENIQSYRWISSVGRASISSMRMVALEKFVKRHPTLKYLILREEMPYYLSPTSSIFSLRNLSVYVREKSFMYYLQYFRGTHAVFEGCVPIVQVHEFIEKWIDGDYYENLKLVHITKTLRGEPFLQELLDRYQVKKQDRSKTPKFFPYNEEDLFYLSDQTNQIAFNGSLFIENKKNDKVASIQFTSKCMKFYIWRKEDIFP